MQLDIRKMTEEDLEAVLTIEQQNVPVPWSKESYLNEVRNQWAYYQVCVLQEQIIGYCGIWNVFEESSITTIVVDKPYRHHGAGRAMMESMEQCARLSGAKKILLEVRPSNEAALLLYNSLGYIEVSRRHAYYADNQEDALVLCKYLDISLEGAVLF